MMKIIMFLFIIIFCCCKTQQTTTTLELKTIISKDTMNVYYFRSGKNRAKIVDIPGKYQFGDLIKIQKL